MCVCVCVCVNCVCAQKDGVCLHDSVRPDRMPLDTEELISPTPVPGTWPHQTPSGMLGPVVTSPV